MDRSNTPLVSVITPIYNHASWIAACIESVLAQSYPHWERVIVDHAGALLRAEAVASVPASMLHLDLDRVIDGLAHGQDRTSKTGLVR